MVKTRADQAGGVIRHLTELDGGSCCADPPTLRSRPRSRSRQQV